MLRRLELLAALVMLVSFALPFATATMPGSCFDLPSEIAAREQSVYRACDDLDLARHDRLFVVSAVYVFYLLSSFGPLSWGAYLAFVGLALYAAIGALDLRRTWVRVARMAA